jgi:hypothetical protein
MLLNDPPTTEPPIDVTETQRQLVRAERILAIFYLTLPLLLVYLLFKVFPTQPWPSDPKEATKLLSDTIYFLGGKIPIVTSLEERLILLVIVAGALGSYIHAATSYVDYRGNREFKPSWLLWYVARPFIGICLALVIYFAVRGGLLLLVLKGSDVTDAAHINPFGVAAVAAMTGMFSKQASDKLAEVFDTLFKSRGDEKRKDSLTPTPATEIKLDPQQGPASGGTAVTITGSGFAAGATVAFGANPATDVTVVSETTITANTPAGAGVVDVVVTNADGTTKTATQAYTYDTEESSDGSSADPTDEQDVHDLDLKPDTPDEDLPITEGGVG